MSSHDNASRSAAVRWPLILFLTIAAAMGFAAADARRGAAAANVGICRASELHLRPALYGEAGGQFTQTFTATNDGSADCSLAGWPTLRLKSRSGKVGAARSIRVVQGNRSSKPFETVVVHPGGAASFDVFGADWDLLANRACPKTHGLLITLPGVAPLSVTVALPYCSPFYIAPIVAGRTDRDAWSAVWAKRWCRIQQFRVTLGPPISEATGQHTLALMLTNRGRSCTLFGIPTLWFEDARGRIPFQLRTGTDQMIRASYALPVNVRRGGSAWVVINHYRCDLGSKRAAGVIRVGLTGASRADTVRIAVRNPYERVDYCGQGDPGSTITVAPFEPTLAAAFGR